MKALLRYHTLQDLLLTVKIVTQGRGILRWSCLLQQGWAWYLKVYCFWKTCLLARVKFSLKKSMLLKELTFFNASQLLCFAASFSKDFLLSFGQTKIKSFHAVFSFFRPINSNICFVFFFYKTNLNIHYILKSRKSKHFKI